MALSFVPTINLENKTYKNDFFINYQTINLKKYNE